MLEIQEKDNVEIVNMIYEIRGKQVMLDSDLAILYGTETKRINEAVRRNKEKFPERFSWILSDEESNIFLAANCDQKIETRGGKYKNPRVFTEQGVAMLATILKTPVATQVSIAIMDAFVLMKKYISTSLLEQKYINNQVMKNTEDIKLLQESFKEFDKKKELNDMFFEGQFYDAYSLLIDILNTATKNIIIIDNYIDKKFLDICSKIKVNIIIYTKEIDKIDLEKYKKQYNNIKVRLSSKYHDRFIILDNKTLYHCGASFKDLGKKCFCISKIENDNVLKELLKIVNSWFNYSILLEYFF